MAPDDHQHRPAQYLEHTVEDDVHREREMHKYYQPFAELLSSSAPSKPFSSPDTALTAFAQLGALRLNARYGMIALFDKQFHYVIAEATQSLSLQGDEIHEEGDDLWFGVAKAPRCQTPCEYAAGLRPPPDGLDKSSLGGDIVIFPDLSQSQEYSQNPMVLEEPFCRFYAGVPVISPAGINIGSYCIYDDKPRKGLSPPEIQFMKDMATTVMGQLDMIRAQAELRRTQHMVHGLGSFIRGNSSLTESWHNFNQNQDPVVTTHKTQKSEQDIQSPSTEMSSKVMANFSKSPGPPQTSRPRSQRQHSTKTKQPSSSASIPSTFQRASDILRESGHLDGVLFLDASIGSYGGLVQKNPARDTSKTVFRDGVVLATSETQESDASDVSTPHGIHTVELPCGILGSSCSASTEHTPEDAELPVPSENLLHSLLNMYPKGRIWTFDDAESDISPNLPKTTDAADTSAEFNRIGDRSKHREKILKLFPGAQSVAFIGMWDIQRGRWFAGAFFWTCKPARTLNAELDLRFFFAFGQSVMAEIARLDIIMADSAKATFISSISHELRTPLHGIMGSSECLQSTEMDAFQTGLLGTIETCSRTLLEVFDNLLAFAKINSLSQSSSSRRRSSVAMRALSTTATSATNDVNLEQLTEEVIEAVFAGYDFAKERVNVHASHRDPAARPGEIPSEVNGIDVVFDCSNPTSSLWNFQMTETGGWRRIVMNLVGNSLKYTDHGSITIKLQATPIPESVGRYQVTLIVRDTGRGMSRDYLQTRLFSAFEQEDSLAPGTGLGLSIVKQIVLSMDGTISVQSQKNQGTEITVSMPLNSVVSVDHGEEKNSEIVDVKNRCQRLRLNMLGVEIGHKSRATSLDSMELIFAGLCNDWFGLDMAPDPQDADIYLITESRLDALSRIATSAEKEHYNRKPLIVLCKDYSAANRLNKSSARHQIVIPQPYGPNKVAKSLTRCLDYIDQCKRHGRSCSVDAGSGVMFRKHAGQDSNRPFGVNREDTFTRDVQDKDSHGRPTKTKLHLATEDQDTRSHPTGIVATGEKVEKDSMRDATNFKQVAFVFEDTTPPPSVLLVDDNRINLQILKTFLQKQKYPFEIATNGLEALNTYTAASSPFASRSTTTPHAPAFAFILMDINMPVMDGLESTRQIRMFERDNNIEGATIIALTGMVSGSAESEAFASGISLYLTKPVRLKELGRILKDRK